MKIVALLETMHTASQIEEIQLPGYKCFDAWRKKRQMGRNSGGIAVYVDNSLVDGVQIIPSPGTENILIKLKSHFLA